MLIGALTPLRCAPCAAPLLRVASYVRVVCVAVVLRVSVVAGCIAVSWLGLDGAHCWLCAALAQLGVLRGRRLVGAARRCARCHCPAHLSAHQASHRTPAERRGRRRGTALRSVPHWRERFFLLYILYTKVGIVFQSRIDGR